MSSVYDFDDNPRTTTNNNNHHHHHGNNDEESIFLSSSSDEEQSLNKQPAYTPTSLYVEDDDDDNQQVTTEQQSNNNEESVEELSDDQEEEILEPPLRHHHHHRPIRVYDEYDPENIDNNNSLSSVSSDSSSEEMARLSPTTQRAKLIQKKNHQRAKASAAAAAAVIDIKTDDSDEDIALSNLILKDKINKKITEYKPTPKPVIGASSSSLTRPQRNVQTRKTIKMVEAPSIQPLTISQSYKRHHQIHQINAKVVKSKEMINDSDSSSLNSVSSDSELEEAVMPPNNNNNNSSLLLSTSGSSSSSSSSPENVISKKVSSQKVKIINKKKLNLNPSTTTKNNKPSITSAIPVPASSSNVISGRIINLSSGSGFKIPKRANSSSDPTDINPPEKKVKRDIVEQPSLKSSNTTTNAKVIVKSKTSTNTATATLSKIKKVINTTNANITKDSTVTSKLVTKKPIIATIVSEPPQIPKIKEKNVVSESFDFMEALGSGFRQRKPKVKPVIVATPPPPQIVTNLSQIVVEKNVNLTTLPLVTDSIQEQTKQNNSSLNNLSRLTSLNETTGLDDNFQKSNMTEPGLKKASKKRVSWADAHSKPIEHIQTFYLDEAEKQIKKSAFQEGQDVSKIEKFNEKELRFKTADNHHNHESMEIGGAAGDMMTNSAFKWPSAGLTPIDLPESTVIPEIRSAENEIQTQRELLTLAVLVFKQFCPDSASEPTEEDSKSSLDANTKIIPLEDVTLNGAGGQSVSHSHNLHESSSSIDEQTHDSTMQEDYDSTIISNKNSSNSETTTHRNSNENNNTPKFYNPNNQQKSTESSSSSGSANYRNYKNNNNNNKSDYNNSKRGGYYNQQHQNQQRRFHQQSQSQSQKSSSETTTSNLVSTKPKQPLLSTPSISYIVAQKPPTHIQKVIDTSTPPPPFSILLPPPSTKTITPLSPTNETSKFSALSNLISAATKIQPTNAAIPPPPLVKQPPISGDMAINIAMSIFRSAEDTDKLKQILSNFKPATASPSSSLTNTLDLSKILSMTKQAPPPITTTTTLINTAIPPPLTVVPPPPSSKSDSASPLSTESSNNKSRFSNSYNNNNSKPYNQSNSDNSRFNNNNKFNYNTNEDPKSNRNVFTVNPFKRGMGYPRGNTDNRSNSHNNNPQRSNSYSDDRGDQRDINRGGAVSRGNYNNNNRQNYNNTNTNGYRHNRYDQNQNQNSRSRDSNLDSNKEVTNKKDSTTPTTPTPSTAAAATISTTAPGKWI